MQLTLIVGFDAPVYPLSMHAHRTKSAATDKPSLAYLASRAVGPNGLYVYVRENTNMVHGRIYATPISMPIHVDHTSTTHQKGIDP